MSPITAPLTDETFAAASAIPRWPSNASSDYITARNDILKDEHGLRAQIERIAAKRRALPPGPTMPTYTFTEGPRDLNQDGPVSNITLADLAADGRSVVLYHMMFHPSDTEPCPMCSMAIDGYNAFAPHLNERITLAIVAKAPIAQLRHWTLKRGWNSLRFLSSHENSFNKDVNVESEDGGQKPGVSVFRRDGGGEGVRFVYQAFPEIEPGSERGLDLLSGTYNVLDLVPEGRGEWYAENDYL